MDLHICTHLHISDGFVRQYSHKRPLNCPTNMAKLGTAMETLAYRADQLTDHIIGCIITVHQTLGPGFPESIYKRALALELPRHELTVETEKSYAVYYRGTLVGRHRVDLLVEGRVIVELKTVENLSRAHYAQVRSYLKVTELELALLVNCDAVRADIRRVQSWQPRVR